MSAGIKVEVELCWINQVLSDTDSAFLHRKGQELNALVDVLEAFRNKVYGLSGPVYAETMIEALKPVEEAKAVALEGWERYTGIFPYTLERGLCLNIVRHRAVSCDAEMSEGRSPWLGRSATDLLHAVEVTRERINGIKNIVAVLLGYHV